MLIGIPLDRRVALYGLPVEQVQEAIEVGKQVLKEISPSLGRVYVSPRMTFEELRKLQKILNVLREVEAEKRWVGVAPGEVMVEFAEVFPALRFVAGERVVKVYAKEYVIPWQRWRGYRIGSIPCKEFTGKALLELLKVVEEKHDEKQRKASARRKDYKRRKEEGLKEIVEQLPKRIWGSTLNKFVGDQLLGDLLRVLFYEVGIGWNEKEKAYDVYIEVQRTRLSAPSYYSLAEIESFKEIAKKIRRESIGGEE